MPVDARAVYICVMAIQVEIDREEDGRFIADVPALPGVLAYGVTREEAIANVKALALRVIADKVEHGEPIPGVFNDLFSSAA